MFSMRTSSFAGFCTRALRQRSLPTSPRVLPAVSSCGVATPLPRVAAVSASLFLLLSLAPTAHAGSWLFHASGSGTATATNGSSSSPTQTWVPPADATNGISFGSFGNGIGQGTSGTSTANINATITGTWVPDPALPSDPAPPSVWVEETASAKYNGTSNNGPGMAVSVSGDASNGLGDPCVKTHSDPVPNTRPNYYSESGVSASSAANRHFTSSSGTITLSRSLSATVTATAGGGSSVELTSYSVSIIATPYAFHKTSGVDNGDGTLSFTYAWKSTSGNIGDLGGCYWHERVAYPGGNPFIPPAPFSVPAGLSNPTVLPGAGTGGGQMSTTTITDTHYQWGVLTPYSGGSVSADQRYEYDCPTLSITNTLIPGTDNTATITRTVGYRPPYIPLWWYSITKQSLTAWASLGN